MNHCIISYLTGYRVFKKNAALGQQTWQSGNETENSRLAVDGNRASNFSLGSCSLTEVSELAWFQTHLGADVKVTGVFIVVRDDDVYQEITELSIRVGYRPEKLGIKDPPCGGTTHRFQRGSGRMIRCLPVEPGWYVTIFSPEVNSTLSLCEVEVETAKLGTVFLRYLVLFTSQVAYTLNQ